MTSTHQQKKGLGAGLKRTPQRLAILDYLNGNTSHPSAEDIYRAVSKRYQSMSFATVYNTLRVLAQAGSVRELTIDPERKRYDPDTTHHHHLICTICGKIDDMPGKIAAAASGHFTVTGSHVEFFGQCTICRKKKKGL